MSSSLLRTIGKSLFQSKLSFNFSVNQVLNYARPVPQPRKRVPVWFTRRNRTIHDDLVTKDNKEFLSEVVSDRYGAPITVNGITKYPMGANDDSILVKVKEMERVEWTPKIRRAGVIARKIGIVPLWQKDGKKIMTTMLQVEDNHVIKYLPPGEFQPTHKPKHKNLHRFGCLMIGACGTDPSMFTKAYCGLFANSGVAPKKYLGRFIISPEAALLPGTPLNVTHFRVGDFVDVRGKTMDCGFQGVMKRWGFKGMPASHGVTKTHRRPGNVGSGGKKARIWPGQKMPGHMGNRYRVLRGLKIWRINTKYNVMWVSGLNIPGETNSMCYIFDTSLPLRRPLMAPHMPTFLGDLDDGVTDFWSDDCHNFKDSTILFQTD